MDPELLIASFAPQSHDELARDNRPHRPDSPSSDSTNSPSNSPSPHLQSSPDPSENTGETGDATASETRASRKRPAEDMTQFATDAARKVRLRQGNCDDLLQFSKMEHAQQSITIQANLLKLLERQDDIQPAEAKYTMSKALKSFIDCETFYVIVLPSLSAYIGKDEPVNIVIDRLVDNAMWGFPTLKNNKEKMDVIEERIRKKLNSRRCDLKRLISESLPPQQAPIVAETSENHGAAHGEHETPAPPSNVNTGDSIVTLCEEIHKRRTYHDSKGEPTAKGPSVQMMARVAFLRRCFVRYESEVKGKDPDKQTFWQYVDSQLESARKHHNNDEAKLSAVFWSLLNKDRELYGKEV